MGLTLYDAARCPYCARARIALAEKGVAYESVVIDLDDRPAWMYDKNPSGKVPVLEEGNFLLPESAVIMEYLEERWPDPALLPADREARAHARVWIDRFDARLGDVYYAVRRRDRPPEDLEAKLDALDAALLERPYLSGPDYGLADIAYLPWVLRTEPVLGIGLERFPALRSWVERLSGRPAIVPELDIVQALAR